MAIAFRSSTTAPWDGTTGTGYVIGVPAGVQAGDLLVLVTAGKSALDTPSGWTQRQAVTSSFGWFSLHTRVAQAGDAGSTVTVNSTSDTGNRCSLALLAYSGAAYTTSAMTATTAVTPSLTSTLDSSMLVAGTSVYGPFGGQTVTLDAALTSRANVANVAWCNLRVGDENRPTAGATGTRTNTIGSNNGHASWSLLLQPLPSLLGEWGFLDNLNDTSGNGRTGSANFTPTYITGPTSGTKGLQFTGSGQTVTYGRTGLEPAAGTGGVTTMGWVLLTAVDANYLGVLHHSRDGGGSTRAGFQLHSERFRPMSRWRDQTSFSDGLATALTGTGWHHFCNVDGENRYEWYIDGVSVASGTRTNHTTAVTWENHPWISGSYGSNPIAGQDCSSSASLAISGLRIFAGELTTAEVNTWMNTPIVGSVAYTGSAATSGSGTATATGSAVLATSGALAGAGALTAQGSPVFVGTATVSGSGVLASQADAVGLTGSAAPSGAGVLNGQGAPAATTAATFSGTGVLAATASPTMADAATVSGAGALTTAGSAHVVAVAALAGAGGLAASGTAALTVTAFLDATGSLTGVGVGTQNSFDLTGSGTLTADGLVHVSGIADCGGVGVLTAHPPAREITVAAMSRRAWAAETHTGARRASITRQWSARSRT